MFVLSILLIVGVAAGAAWPLIQRWRLQQSGGDVSEAVSADITTSPSARRATEQLCPYCSRMNPASRTVCLDCGNALPVNNLAAIFDGVDREEAIRELKQGAILFAAMILAMCLSNWLATPWKIGILLLTLGILVFRFHRGLLED